MSKSNKTEEKRAVLTQNVIKLHHLINECIEKSVDNQCSIMLFTFDYELPVFAKKKDYTVFIYNEKMELLDYNKFITQTLVHFLSNLCDVIFMYTVDVIRGNQPVTHIKSYTLSSKEYYDELYSDKKLVESVLVDDETYLDMTIEHQREAMTDHIIEIHGSYDNFLCEMEWLNIPVSIIEFYMDSMKEEIIFSDNTYLVDDTGELVWYTPPSE